MMHSIRYFSTMARRARGWWERLRGGTTEVSEDEPLRAELYSADQMALYGKRLAAEHVVANTRLPDQLLARLACRND